MSNEKYDEIMENYWLVELARTNSNKLVACKNWYLTTSFNTSISEAMFKMEDAYPLAYDDETGEIAISMKTKANAMYSFMISIFINKCKMICSRFTILSHR